MIDTTRLENVTNLTAGAHDPNGEYCVMEAAAFIAGETWSDAPECVCPVIAAFLRRWNDDLPDDDTRNRLLLPLIPRIINSQSTDAVAERRSLLCLDWLIRVQTPAWLSLAKLTDAAESLRGLPEITMASDFPLIRSRANAARTAAWDAARTAAGTAAGTAAWAAARDAAWDAAGDAAGAAARDAAWDAAGAAAFHAAWDAARDAARDAAWDAAGAAAFHAARDAAGAAARDAAWDAAGAAAFHAAFHAARDAAWAAAGAAAWAAAGAAMSKTVDLLQQSAVDLLHRILAAEAETQ